MTQLIIEVIALVAIFLISITAKAQSVGSMTTADDMRNRTGTNGFQVITNGKTTMFDGFSGVYVWCDTCTGTDDGFSVIKNPSTNSGRWQRLKFATTGNLQAAVDSLKMRVDTIGKFAIYDKAGLRSDKGKLFTDTFSLTTATPTISLSAYLTAMGCSNFKLISATGFRAGATTSNAPNVAITGMTSNSVSLIFNQTNTAVVSILGINVLSGLPTILVPDPTNVKAVLSFYAW